MKNSLKSICIVGGGTSGWMAASLLASLLKRSGIKITLIESPDIATIGVGESTVPSIMNFLKACRINPKEFVAATSGSFKLGIQFQDWRKSGSCFFHPFGSVGQDINGMEFYQAWLKTCADGHCTRWVDHSPCAIMAENQRFMLRPDEQKNWTLSNYSYALHLDAVLAARYLRDLSLSLGVERIESTVKKVHLDNHGYIKSVQLIDNRAIVSDFFIDCTGFKGLLIQDALNVGYEDWTHYLPCDKAVAVQTESVGGTAPYTISTAREAGWTWKIPLQHRTGNGYVFSSQHCSDDNAIDTLLSALDGKLLNDPRVIPFVTGRRKKIWHKNCLSLGLASGFLEPLESTAIHLVYGALVHFINHFPDKDFESYNETEFNKQMNSDYQEVRDFIILHYCTTSRKDTPFWRRCQSMPIPDSLSEKINLFRERGQVHHTEEQFFSRESWVSILEGMGVRPKKYHPLMDAIDEGSLARRIENGSQNILSTVLSMPSHSEYISRNCAAKKMV